MRSAASGRPSGARRRRHALAPRRVADQLVEQRPEALAVEIAVEIISAAPAATSASALARWWSSAA